MSESNPTEQAILAQIREQQELLQKTYQTVEKTRRLFFWTLAISVLAFCLPLIGLLFAIPFFLNSYVAPVLKDLGI